MTEQRMNHLLATTPGIGVKATQPAGENIYFFYEDFNGPADGIDRAMKQLYPLMNKGVYSSLTFIEKHKG